MAYTSDLAKTSQGKYTHALHILPSHTHMHAHIHTSISYLAVKTGGLVSDYLIFSFSYSVSGLSFIYFCNPQSIYLLFLHIIFFQLSICVHAIMFCSAVIMLAIS